MNNQAPQVDAGFALQAALRWSWSIPRQYARLQSATAVALAKQAKSESMNFYGAEHQQPLHEIATETHMLLVAAHHLQVATELLHLTPPSHDTELAKLLRNIQEHWNDVSGWSLTKFQADYGDPSSTDAQAKMDASRLQWSHTVVICIGGLGLDEISQWASDVYGELAGATSP